VNIHLASIIPLIVGLVLLAIGLTFGNQVVSWISAVIITYGLLVHTNNVAVIRRANKPYRYRVGYR
jgi:hypothetical protein